MKRLRTGWKFISLILLTFAAFSYAMFQGGFVSWFLFYSFIPFAIYSFLFMIYPVRNFRVDRKVNQEQFTVGQNLVATITISRKIPFPLFYLLVEDELSERLRGSHTNEPKKLMFPWFKRKIEFNYVLQHITRGEHELKSIRIRTGDMFGLVEKEVSFEIEDKFLVYPSTVKLSYQPQQRHFEQGSASKHAKYWQDSNIAVGVREYQPGDKFAWIDWKATARRDMLMTKEFEQLQSHDVVIIIDREQCDVFEEMVTYTVSIAQAIIKSGARAALISIGMNKHIFPLKNDEQHVRNMLFHLAKVDCDSQVPLSSTLEKGILNTEMKQVTNLIVTSKITVDFVRRIEQVVGHHQSFTIFMIKQQTVSSEELILIERLNRRRIDVKVITSLEIDNEFKGVVNS